VTVIGSKQSFGSNGPGSLGLVTVSGVFGTATSPLQSLLNTASGAVTGASANFENINIAGLSGNIATTGTSGATGIFELTNVNSLNGSISTGAGNANISAAVPSGYNTIIVDAAGTETLSGNGAANQLDIFSGNSTVNFNTGGGSGTVVAAGSDDNVVLVGTSYSFIGSPLGGETVSGVASNSVISVSGSVAGSGTPQTNVVGLGSSNDTVVSAGTNDLVEVFNGGTGIVSVLGTADVLVDGGAATVDAAAGSSGINAFFNTDGGALDFVNQSNNAATVSGGVPGTYGGFVTAFGGTGGGLYIGGAGGNNSLVGGTGLVTLIAAGATSYLQGSTSTATGNNEFVGGAGSATMIGAVGSVNNQFFGGTGTESIVSSGSGTQNYLVGASGQEIFTGSTVSGATNSYFFDQNATGEGSDIITNFRTSTDKVSIDQIADNGQVTIAGITANTGAGGGSIVTLSDNTTITLYGVGVSALKAAGASVGGSSF